MYSFDEKQIFFGGYFLMNKDNMLLTEKNKFAERMDNNYNFR